MAILLNNDHHHFGRSTSFIILPINSLLPFWFHVNSVKGLPISSNILWLGQLFQDILRRRRRLKKSREPGEKTIRMKQGWRWGWGDGKTEFPLQLPVLVLIQHILECFYSCWMKIDWEECWNRLEGGPHISHTDHELRREWAQEEEERASGEEREKRRSISQMKESRKIDEEEPSPCQLPGAQERWDERGKEKREGAST